MTRCCSPSRSPRASRSCASSAWRSSHVRQAPAERRELLAGLGRLAGVACRPGLVLRDALLADRDHLLRVGQLAGVLGGGLARLADAPLVLHDLGMDGGGGRLGRRHGFLAADSAPGEIGQRGVQLAEARVEGRQAAAGDENVERAQLVLQLLVAARLAGLALQGTDLALDLADDVGQAQQVGLGLLQLAQGLLAVGLELGDAGGLLEDAAAILGARGENGVDLPLGHHRVAVGADARAHEEALDVAQAAGVLVDEIGPLARAENAPRDRDLVELRVEDLVAVGEGDADLRHVHRRAGVGAVEEHIQHLGAAQRRGALLAEHPADGVGDVALAAAVRPDDGDQSGLEMQLRAVGEALEARHFQRLEMHV